ncbi:MAG: hypothetical protein AAGI88_21695 [Pseudomonadota bacterium]
MNNVSNAAQYEDAMNQIATLALLQQELCGATLEALCDGQRDRVEHLILTLRLIAGNAGAIADMHGAGVMESEQDWIID